MAGVRVLSAMRGGRETFWQHNRSGVCSLQSTRAFRRQIPLQTLSDAKASSYTIVGRPSTVDFGSRRSVPDQIGRPDYSKSMGLYGLFGGQTIPVLSASDIATLRQTCKLASDALLVAEEVIRPGVTTDEIDAAVHRAIIGWGAYPSPLGYNGFPRSVCTSVNNVVVHGIPDDTVLKYGDIINVDVTVFKDGFHGDNSRMFLVGNVDETGRRLVNVTRQALDAAVAICGPGVRYEQIAEVIEDYVHDSGFTVCPDFTGHGIGRQFHCPPTVFATRGHSSPELVMRPGHAFTIEPCVNEGTERSKTLEDGWTAVTCDGLRSAQWEYTLVVTDQGAEVLTVHPR